MKLDKELYQQTFSRLTAPSQLRKELLAMTEQTEKKRRPKKFILRRLVVAAMVMALAFALAMGANAATDGELFGYVAEYVTSFTTPEGDTVQMYTGKLESGETVYYNIETEGGAEGELILDGSQATFYKDKDDKINKVVWELEDSTTTETHHTVGDAAGEAPGSAETDE